VRPRCGGRDGRYTNKAPTMRWLARATSACHAGSERVCLDMLVRVRRERIGSTRVVGWERSEEGRRCLESARRRAGETQHAIRA
jgi:hypothetical protein